MKKLISITLLAMLFGTGLVGCAQDSMKKDGMPMTDTMPITNGSPMAKGRDKKMDMDMGMHMKMMDVNGDGMISKEEFMKFHESMFDKMKKDSNGMVSMKDMRMMMEDMMKK
jgi:hypothetical protein